MCFLHCTDSKKLAYIANVLELYLSCINPSISIDMVDKFSYDIADFVIYGITYMNFRYIFIIGNKVVLVHSAGPT